MIFVNIQNIWRQNHTERITTDKRGREERQIRYAYGCFPSIGFSHFGTESHDFIVPDHRKIPTSEKWPPLLPNSDCKPASKPCNLFQLFILTSF